MSDSLNQSQLEFVREYFKNNPDREISHSESKAELERAWKAKTGKRFEDSDRSIRRLHQDGFLVKVRKGVYKFDPDVEGNPQFADFSAADKAKILERDGYRCVVCHQGAKEGVELQVDHIKPKDLGGAATIENGQTLCGRHNYMKKNHRQTEFGKKMFIRLYEDAIEQKLSTVDNDEDEAEVVRFLEAILSTYEEFRVDNHIKWRPTDRKP